MAPFPAGAADDTAVVVRLYYGDRARLAQLVETYDVFEFADHKKGFVIARLREDEFQSLSKAGYRMEVDTQLTQESRRVLQKGSVSAQGIPSYPCYRTVEETEATLAFLATQRPDLATLVDIGDSWEKIYSGGRAGHDLYVLALSNKAHPGPKPRFFLMAEHHARELTTAETATRFAEELVAGYGVDPDITWILDESEIHILPMANPDGRKLAELGQYWRKNTDRTNTCATYPYYGVDLNRNMGFSWGQGGSSVAPCDEIYRGALAFSEPENQAIRDYVLGLFPDRRSPALDAPAPDDTSGLFISLHSFAQLVLFPWGFTAEPAPNYQGLQTLGAKFGYFNRYTVQQSIQLYPTSGTADEWAYGELGVAAYTIEMGTSFFEPCASFTASTYPSNRLALLYASKACRQPYRDPAGPDVTSIQVSASTNLVGAQVTLTARADAARFGGVVPALPVSKVTAARWSLDRPSWVPGSAIYFFSAPSIQWGLPQATLTTTLDTSTWAPGRHTVLVEAMDANGIWGVPSAIFVHIEPLRLKAQLVNGTCQLQWPGLLGRTYTIWQAAELSGPYTKLAQGWPAQVPTTTFTPAPEQLSSRFYRVSVDP